MENKNAELKKELAQLLAEDFAKIVIGLAFADPEFGRKLIPALSKELKNS